MELEFEKPLLELEAKVAELSGMAEKSGVSAEVEIAELKKRMKAVSRKLYAHLTPWQTVQIARHPERPLFRDYVRHMCGEFIELHGDRCFGDDPSIAGGFATIGDQRVMLIGHQKGKTVEENVHFNFGMASPEGYRKALRLMRLAEKYRLPVVSLVDTPGAYPGLDAEARGQAEAIARNLTEMALLNTPIVVVVTGEGGSGGALGIAVGDIVMMLSNSIYSVISPEGCAAILWKDGAKAPEAAAALKLTAASLLELKVIDEIVPEPDGGAHRSTEETVQAVREAVLKHLQALRKLSHHKLVERRQARYAKIGQV
jgi:acetyl-CoA carboxylase carboxyl transferase subunit alpha